MRRTVWKCNRVPLGNVTRNIATLLLSSVLGIAPLGALGNQPVAGASTRPVDTVAAVSTPGVGTAPATRPAPGMRLPFRKVDALSRPALFVAHDNFLWFFDVSQATGFQLGPRVYEGAIGNSEFAVRPDGTRFYLGAGAALLEFDAQARLLRRIPAKEFQLKGGEFNWGAAASNERLWLTVLASDHTYAIIEWQPDQPPPSRINVSVDFPSGTAVDSRVRQVYVPYPGVVIDFAAGKQRKNSWRDFGFADFDPERGLLLSDAGRFSKLRGSIVHIDLTTREQTVVTKGSHGTWGPDGWVYFDVGPTQLWRCRIDGSRREPVYMASTYIQRDPGWSRPPCFSEDRTRLAFFYYNADTWDPYGLVLIDLQTQEYRELLHLLPLEHFAWVVKTGPTSSTQAAPK